MFTPWTAYAVTVVSHSRELHDAVATPRSTTHRQPPARPTARSSRRHAARPVTSGC